MVDRKESLEVRYSHFGGGPGAGGGYRFTATPVQGGFRVVNWEGREILAEERIAGRSGWRAIAQAASSFQIWSACEVEVIGADKIGSEIVQGLLTEYDENMLGWWWTLASLENAVLRAFRREVGSFVEDPARKRGRALWDELQERGGEAEDLASAIREAVSESLPSFEAVHDKVLLWHEARELEAARRRAEWDARVGPHRERIEALLREWRKQNPASGSVHEIGLRMKAADLLAYATYYAFDHGTLPVGEHEIPKRGGSFRFDFDELNRRLPPVEEPDS